MCLVHVDNLLLWGLLWGEPPHPGRCVIPLGQVLPVRKVQTADVNAVPGPLNAAALGITMGGASRESSQEIMDVTVFPCSLHYRRMPESGP